MRSVVWFRGKDLRLSDHPALCSALSTGEVVLVFVVDPYFFAPERAQKIAHRMQFLVESLQVLSDAIAARGSRLWIAHGESVHVVPRIAAAVRADRVTAMRWSEPFGVERDRRVAAALAADGRRLDLFEGETLAAPGQVRTGSGTPFAVFTPFSRAFAKSVTVDAALEAPRVLPPPPAFCIDMHAEHRNIWKGDDGNDWGVPSLASLGIERNPRLVAAGEQAAEQRLGRFFQTGAASRYTDGRNQMGCPDGVEGTSRLSQDLKFGTLSARHVWHTSRHHLEKYPDAKKTYLNELVWREFAYDVVREKPQVMTDPFRPAWRGFPWRNPDLDRGWQAWVEGKTGYPVVDAAARQLLAEGFVHNRARMIAASFLCKHLLLDYRLGEAHYMQHLTDGDWAINNLAWQWSAGCGVDAQPWFRVFNPVTQGENFDADGVYVKRWVPELAKLHAKYIHKPWEAPPLELRAANIELGRTYPRPVVDHALARGRFIATAEGYLRSTE